MGRYRKVVSLVARYAKCGSCAADFVDANDAFYGNCRAKRPAQGGVGCAPLPPDALPSQDVSIHQIMKHEEIGRCPEVMPPRLRGQTTHLRTAWSVFWTMPASEVQSLAALWAIEAARSGGD